MKISNNWLKNYLNTDLSVEETAVILTDIGLEVEGIETVESIKGGLEGIVIGEVRSTSQHPNADRLKLTKVEVGHAEPLDIVCGAPNVAEGQKVVVALVGTTLYPDEKGFQIKKSKIRGELSEGMLCAEDEIGLGQSHDGIMIVDQAAKVGTPAAEYFNISSETVFEIGLTPNRIDAASHYGVARDLAAYLKLQQEDLVLTKPDVSSFKTENTDFAIEVEVADAELCPRYSGISISNLKVADSPEWLQNNLKAIGLKPINNIVDITNYVMHELGQPLHAFDAALIEGRKVVVKKANEGQSFVTLDGVERTLSENDLMICDTQKPMCIAGVFGGEQSGVSHSTSSIFLESAYFNAVSVRKTAKRHGLNTDASFRFERGADPNMTVYALKRAALLIQELAGGEISSELIDLYPNPIEDHLVELEYQKLNRLIGNDIAKSTVNQILENLEIKILNKTSTGLRLNVPAYRVDVQRDVDVIEEVLRIYGYNNVKLPSYMRSNVVTNKKLSPHKVENTIADYLSSNGFAEVFNNSLSNPNYYEEVDHLVSMVNPLSKETEVLRATMLYGGLEAIVYNQNRKRKNLKFYEFGTTYEALGNSSFKETKRLAMWMSGDMQEESWQQKKQEVDFFSLKEKVENCLKRLGIQKWKSVTVEDAIFNTKVELRRGKNVLVSLGAISNKELKKVEGKQAVYYAEFNWTMILNSIGAKTIQHVPVSKFPSVRRDLALLIDKSVAFDEIKSLAKKAEQRILKEVNLFDVYEGKNLGQGKKSYAVSFLFQDAQKTLTDKQIDKVMERLISSFEKELKAELR